MIPEAAGKMRACAGLAGTVPLPRTRMCREATVRAASRHNRTRDRPGFPSPSPPPRPPPAASPPGSPLAAGRAGGAGAAGRSPRRRRTRRSPAASARSFRVRAGLVLRPHDLAAALRSRRGLPVGRSTGGRGPPGEPGSAGPTRLLPAGPRRDRDRAAIRHRALRHHALLRPHAPARDPHLPRRAGDRAGRADHAGPASRHAGRAAALGPAHPPLAHRPGDRPPARRLAPLHRRDVGNPLLAALRRRARERLAARPGARALPGELDALLVAHGGPRPEPVADEPPGTPPVHVPGDAVFLLALLLATAAWMRHDEAVTRRREAMEDA